MASKKSENVRVAVRCRPLMPKEVTQGHECIIDTNSNSGEIVIKNPKVDAGEPPKTFSFDSVYGMDSQQETVYLDTGYPIVESSLEGYNGTIFAYGQTGSGKTHTMEGKHDNFDERGITPRAFEQIFYGVELRPETQFLVRVSYLEIYNEETHDLLAANPKKTKLEMKESADTGFYVKDLSSFVCKTIADMINIMNTGRQNRHVGETKMNRESSRSHSIFTITIETSETGSDQIVHYRVGKLNLVDLAGSERQSKTESTGDRLKEATNINKSLLTLGIVITSLVDGNSSHIPYRDSKLTKLLQESLGGNSKTVMIANVGPADWNYDETISTLRYASRAKNIKCKPKINEDPKDAMLREFQDEIARLKAQLEMQGLPVSGDQLSHGGLIMNTAEPQIVEIERIVKIEDKAKVRELESKIESEKEQIRIEAASEREAIELQKNLAEEKKAELLEELRQKEEEQQKAKDNQKKLIRKLKRMEEKLITGTQAMEVAVRQEQELQKTNAELEARKRKELDIARKLEEKKEDWQNLEQRFSSQQEEIEDKNKKLKKLFGKYQVAQTEIRDLQHEFQIEREDMADTIRVLTQELRLKSFIVESFVPNEEIDFIENKAEWNDEDDVWSIPKLELAGNNINRPILNRQGQEEGKEDETTAESKGSVYFVYTEDGAVREDNLSNVQKKRARVQSARRPGTANRKKKSSQFDDQVQPKEPTVTYPKARGLVK